MRLYTPPKPAEFIPVIDLGPSFSVDMEDRKAVAWEIHKACRDTGFFYVVNHGVPTDLMDRHLNLAREFFAMPAELKAEVDVSKSPCTRGFEAMAAQTLDEGSPPDLKEGFLMGVDLPLDHPYVVNKVPNTGPNQWPSNPPGFKRAVNEYMGHMVRLGTQLMRCIALSLELPESYFDEGLADPLYIGRMLHYPPHPNTAAFNQLGCGAHTDWGMLTMLLQDDVGGLEIENAAGEWIKAPYVPRAFIINLGEMMPVLTNGLYHSNPHRVLNNTSGRDRYSAPTFFDPNYFYHVKCVPTCMPENGKPLFAETTVGQHIANMYAKTYGKVA